MLGLSSEISMTIDAAPGVPSHIALLLNENFDLGRPDRVVKKLKEMAGELQDQAQSSQSASVADIATNPLDTTIVLSGGLDLFSGVGACQAFECRLNYVDEVARSVVLMADKVTLHDYFEEFFLSIKRRPTKADVYPILSDFYVLQRLRPLIEAGLVKFLRTSLPICLSCIDEFDARVDAIADELVASFVGLVNVDRSGVHPVIDSGPLFEPSLMFTASKSGASGLSDTQLIRDVIREVVRVTIWDARDASFCDGVLFSNARIGLIGLLNADGRQSTPAAVRKFEAHGAANLPWVRGLTIEQTIQLRSEARNALPALRAMLGRRLKDAASQDGSLEPDYIRELREQAVEVRNELELVTTRSSSFRRNVTGVVGLGIAAFGAAIDSPLAAAVGLMGTLNLLHQMPEPEHKKEDLLKRRPAYVLIAAQDILAHKNNKNGVNP